MMKWKIRRFIFFAACVFCAVEGFIYAAVVILEIRIGRLAPEVLEYSAIILCFAFSLLFLNKKEGRFVAAALLFTVAADYFLVILDDFYLAAVSLFIITQFIHMLNIHSGDGPKTLTAALLLRAAAVTAAEIAAAVILGAEFGLLYGLAAFYFVNLTFNALYALLRFRRNALLAAGLALFVGCDISVGLSFMEMTSVFLLHINIIWLFYLPSQVLIALSPVRLKHTAG